MKKTVFYSVLIFVIIIVSFFAINNRSLISENQNKQSEILINQNSEMEFEADKAIIILGVESTSNKVKEAVKENNNKINSIKEVLEGYSNIEFNTASYRVQPIYYRNEDNKEELKYYKVVNMFEITLNDIQKTAEIIDKTLNTGANKVSRINYSLSYLDEAKNKVINKAIKKLEKKASSIAESLNKEEYKLKKLQLNDNNHRNRIYDMQNITLEKSQNSTSIIPEKMSIEVSLQAEYLLFD